VQPLGLREVEDCWSSLAVQVTIRCRRAAGSSTVAAGLRSISARLAAVFTALIKVAWIRRNVDADSLPSPSAVLSSWAYICSMCRGWSSVSFRDPSAGIR
jgi:hypothetical protein